MDIEKLKESIWARGWKDAVHGWKSAWFIVLEAVLAPIPGFLIEWWWSIVTVVGGMFCIWLVATSTASLKQRNEARKRINELEAELEKPEQFDVLCPAKSISLTINRLDDGSYGTPAAKVSIPNLKILNKGDISTIIKLTITPKVLFTSFDNRTSNKRIHQQLTNSIRLKPMVNPFAKPSEREFSWDNRNPQLWELKGLPLTMGKDEIQRLPMISVLVVDGNDVSSRFDNGDKCRIVLAISIRTDKGSPVIPEQTISVDVSDIKT